MQFSTLKEGGMRPMRRLPAATAILCLWALSLHGQQSRRIRYQSETVGPKRSHRMLPRANPNNDAQTYDVMPEKIAEG